MNGERPKRDSLALALLIGSGSVFLLSLLGSGIILLFAGISILIGNPEAAQSSWTLCILLFCLALWVGTFAFLAWGMMFMSGSLRTMLKETSAGGWA